jgi:coenzyme F420-0:L-glutamate ligase/coenzyme F420-1:gamma-L-glutamate ligase
VVARRGPTAIVQTHHGFVMAAGGIDASNVDKTHLVLLPADPDASARALRADLLARGLDVAVIISDTMGRAWRNGLTDVALGAAGIEPFRDHRGEIDPYGNELQLTQMAVIDELASAGELVKGKMDQVPVAVVRGYPRSGGGDSEGAAALLRDAASDMFSLGTAEARAAGLRAAATVADDAPPTATTDAAPVDRDAVDRALATVAEAIAPGTTVTAEDGGTALRVGTAGTTPAALVRLGADAHRLRAALAAEGVTSSHATADDGTVRIGLTGAGRP